MYGTLIGKGKIGIKEVLSTLLQATLDELDVRSPPALGSSLQKLCTRQQLSPLHKAAQSLLSCFFFVGAGEEMGIFEPFRAIGYITTAVPFSVQRLGTETFVTVSVGKAWQVYDVSLFFFFWGGLNIGFAVNACWKEIICYFQVRF